ncbi:MAG TPA: response regulator transcription factor [Acidobacteriaceae bacterium]
MGMQQESPERSEPRPDGVRVARVGVVATDPLRVLGLKAIFADLPDIEIVPLSIPGAFDDAGLSLIIVDSGCTPHLFELLAAFRKARPQLRLVVLGTDTSAEHIERVIGAGVKGYLPASAQEGEVRLAIETVRDGSIWAPRKVLSRLLDTGNETPAPRFTQREGQILQLLRNGRSNREISAVLGIDESTVKGHIGRLMRKVGVTNRIALTVHPLTQPE